MGTCGTLFNQMNIIINEESSDPLFAQLVGQIKQAVAGGHIKPGDQLPSIRQLANDLEINNKTVAKAYALLERDAVIVAKGYRGSFVHPDAVNNCTIDITNVAENKLLAVVSELKSMGLTDSELRLLFADIINKTSRSYS